MARSFSNLVDSLLLEGGVSVVRDVPMSTLTTWRTGGPADIMVEVANPEALREVLERLALDGVPTLILGNGSNLLVADAGFRGVVLRLRDKLASVEVDGEVLSAGAGAMLAAATGAAAAASLAGFEFAQGIPGTVGGAVMANAGTYAGCTADITTKVCAMTLAGEERIFEEFDNRYRKPLVAEGHVVTRVTFRLRHGEKDSIRAAMREVRSRREVCQPTGEATAGSVFKNPPGNKAGKLIEECGLKGRAVGGARISEVHANFIINDGGATAQDIRSLMKLAAAEVKYRCGITLETEVRLVGFDKEC